MMLMVVVVIVLLFCKIISHQGVGMGLKKPDAYITYCHIFTWTHGPVLQGWVAIRPLYMFINQKAVVFFFVSFMLCSYPKIRFLTEGIHYNNRQIRVFFQFPSILF